MLPIQCWQLCLLQHSCLLRPCSPCPALYGKECPSALHKGMTEMLASISSITSVQSQSSALPTSHWLS